MPEKKPVTPADRVAGSVVAMHPRLNGDLVSEPEDLLEGKGDFRNLDGSGNPEGGRLGEPESPDARGVYAGRAPDATTKQNTSDVPYAQNSFQLSQPIVEGDPVPSPLFAAKIPKPPVPIIKKERLEDAGYPASSPQSPYWVRFSFARRIGRAVADKQRSLNHTTLGPAVPVPPVLQGQVVAVTLPTEVPEGATHVGVWMSEPNRSSATAPGPMRLQREVDLAKHAVPTYDLTGPYRFEGRTPPASNETALAPPPSPHVEPEIIPHPSRPGSYRFLATFALGTQEGARSPVEGPYLMPPSPLFGPDEPAAYGYIRVERPVVPPGATGWFLYVMVDNQWHRIYNKGSGLGRAQPWPLQTRKIYVTGWSGSEARARDAHLLLDAREPPEADSTALPAPAAEPEEPVVSGAEAPDVGRIYVRVTDSVRGAESEASDYAHADLAFGEIARVVFRDPTNLVPNGDHAELKADGTPADHSVNRTGGYARVEAGDLVLGTNAAQAGATPELPTDLAPIDPASSGLVETVFAVEDPVAGVFAGSVETVLAEHDANRDLVATRVLHAATAPGDFETQTKIAPAGTTIPGTAFAWNARTRHLRLIHRLAGASKNARLRVRKKRAKNHKHGDRARGPKRPYKPQKPNPVAGKTPPGGGAAIEPPPEVAPPPAAFPFPFPDRPLSRGAVLQDANLNAGNPEGWTQSVSGGAELSYAAAAELEGVSGGLGLLLRDAGTAQQGRALISRDLAGPAGRHDAGQRSKNRFSLLPGGGHVELHAIRRASDARAITWLRFGAVPERASVRIVGSPVAPGSVAVILDGARTEIPVLAVREQSTLSITAAPTNGGTVAVTLDGASRNVPVGGIPEYARIRITGAPHTTGYVRHTLNGVSYQTKAHKGESAATVAARMRAKTYPGWDVSGSGADAYFRATTTGPRSNTTAASNGTGALPVVTTLAEGVTETAAELAGRIRETAYPGWTTSRGPTLVDVVFTAVDAGPKGDLQFSGASTGAAGTVTVNAQGAADTPAELAARIRSVAYAGYAASGSGDAVIFAATTGGVRQDARYDPGATGAAGSAETVTQGTGADLLALAREDDGTVRERLIMRNVASTDVFLVDQTVSGAGTDEAVVSVWGSVNGGARRLLARWEDVDLEQSRVRHVEKGVAFESNPGTTWELHTDGIRVTDRGENYFRDHNAAGFLINQAHGFFLPTQPVRHDLYLQDFRVAVIPGATYTVGAFLRHDDAFGNAHPISVAAYTPKGAAVPVISGEVEITATGDSAWREVSRTFTVPSGCYEVVVSSRDVGAGEFVVQELVVSPGSVAKRTGRYAESCSYATTLEIADPDPYPVVRLGRRRRSLATDVGVPAGASANVSYYASPGRFGPWEGPFSDPAFVPEYDNLRVEVSYSGDGREPVVVRSGSPRAEYVLLSGSMPIATLLKGDRSELPGGATFATLEEWADRPEVAKRRLPGGRIHRQKMFDPVGVVPEGRVQVHTAEARRYLEEMGELELLVLEAFDEILTIKTSAPFRFKRETLRLDGGRGHYVAPMPEAEIVERRPMP